MINSATLEGILPLKPILMEGRDGVATEFNLAHKDMTGTTPVIFYWRCKATGVLAERIAEKASKGQYLVVQGKLIQEAFTHDGVEMVAVKYLVQDVSFGRIRAPHQQ